MSATETSLPSSANSIPSQVRGWIMLVTGNIFFAGAYVAGKFALTTVSPITLNALRFALASLILAPVVVRQRHALRMGRADALTFVAVSLLSFVLNKYFEYVGVNLTTASDAALLISGEGIFTATLAWIVLRERASVRHIAALALGTLGVYLIIERGFAPHIDPGGGAQRILGDAFFLLSLVFEAVASIVSKRLAGRFTPLLVTAATVVGSLAVWIPAGATDIALHGLRLSPLSAGGIIYQAVFVTAIGYFCWFGGLQAIAGSAAAATLFIQPLMGTLLAVLILHDALSPFTLIGGGCIIASVWVISRLSGDASHRKTRSPAHPSPADVPM
jgi:drug/metabolite transporter (DMT)-like permease